MKFIQPNIYYPAKYFDSHTPLFHINLKNIKNFKDTPSKRETLVQELRKLIKIDLYGKCVRGAKCDFEYCYNRELGKN